MFRHSTFKSPKPSLVLRLNEGKLVSGRAAAGETSQCESQQASSSRGGTSLRAPDLTAACWMRLIQVRRSSLDEAYNSYMTGGVESLIRYIPRS